MLLLALCLISGIAQDSAYAAEPSAPANKIDHILLWGRNIDEVTSIMTTKLGFQVKPGRDPSGVANRFVRFADLGYIELLGMTKPNPEMDPGEQADQASLHGGAGARQFGLHTTELDQARTLLQQRGFGVTPIFSAAANDPDGTGPQGPRRWQLFVLQPSPLSSGTFLIDYAPLKSDPASVMDDRIGREQPNGARALSAIWLLSADAAANKTQFERMGFSGAKAVHLPQIAARGYCIPVGGTGVLALEPDGPGIAADTLHKQGPEILGVSVGVADLDRAQRRVARGYEQTISSYKGVFGESFLAPTQADLGILLEFHALSAKASVGVCGNKLD
ncbi:VOC family protein [Dyella acidiphila]|nr:VOC family protein [Dyella acidiphila]